MLETVSGMHESCDLGVCCQYSACCERNYDTLHTPVYSDDLALGALAADKAMHTLTDR
jgi:hypothetical protein